MQEETQDNVSPAEMTKQDTMEVFQQLHEAEDRADEILQETQDHVSPEEITKAEAMQVLNELNEAEDTFEGTQSVAIWRSMKEHHATLGPDWVHVEQETIDNLRVPEIAVSECVPDLVDQNVFLRHSKGQIEAEINLIKEMALEKQEHLQGKIEKWRQRLAEVQMLNEPSADTVTSASPGQKRRTSITEDTSFRPALPAELEVPLLDFCAHHKIEILEKELFGILLDGRFAIKRISSAIPHYRVVLQAHEVYTGQKVLVKFVWKMAGRRTHDVFLREFYTLYHICRGSAAAVVPFAETFSAPAAGRLAFGIMDALRGRRLEEELRTKEGDRGMSNFRAAQVSDQLLCCLAKCHAVDVICGDVRPASIWMGDDGLTLNESGETELKLLDWSHSWLKDPKKANLGSRFVKELHRLDAEMSRNLQIAQGSGQTEWIEKFTEELAHRLEYFSTEQYQQLFVAGGPRTGPFALEKPPNISEETDVFQAGMSILRCFRQGAYPKKVPVWATVHSRMTAWLQKGFPSEGKTFDAMAKVAPCPDSLRGPNHEWPNESFIVAECSINTNTSKHIVAEAIVGKAMQSKREYRYQSIDRFRESLLGWTQLDRLTNKFLTSHTKAANKANTHWPLQNDVLSMPHIWRILDVLERPDRPSFTHVIISRFSEDVPIEAIRNLTRIFLHGQRAVSDLEGADSPSSQAKTVRTISALFHDTEYPRESVKCHWQWLKNLNAISFILILVRHLDLSGGRVVDATEVAAGLGWEFCPLLSLFLSKCYLRDENAILLSKSLRTNVGLQILDLSENLLTDASMTSLVDGLKHNPSVTSLSLARNTLGYASALALAGLFEHHVSPPPLAFLELSQNRMGGGLLYLGRAMQGPASSGLVYLGLNDNGLMIQDAQDIANGIVINNRLRVLNMAHNQFGRAGIQAVFGGMNERWKRHGAQPLELDISENGIPLTHDERYFLDWLHVAKNESYTKGYTYNGVGYEGGLDLGLEIEVRSLRDKHFWKQEGCIGPVQWPACESTSWMANVVVWTD